MGIALSLVLFAIVSMAFLAYLGYGLVKLLLPREWRSEEGLLAPLLGYTFLLLAGYYAVSTVLDLRHVLFIALGLATLLNALALWRNKGERLSINLRETGWAWLLAGLAFLLCILPLLHYGYATTIGENWDPELYLPTTEYLLRAPLKGIPTMPPNPLRELNADPGRTGLTLGFSILQGTLQQLAGWDALRSFAPTLALLHGLAVLALYLLFRRVLRMAQIPALLATALTAVNAQALWVAFFNYGLQTSSLALVPLGLLLLVGVLRHPSWRGVLATGLAVAAVPVAYYPGTTVLVPLAAALGLCELMASRRRWATLVAGLGSILASLLLAWGPILDYVHGFSARFSIRGGLMVTRFITWSEILGFSSFSIQPEVATGLLTALQIAAIALTGLLALAAVVRNRDRALWLALALPGLLYLLWLRGYLGQAVTFLQQHRLLPALGQAVAKRLVPYPYAYMKAAPFVAPLLLGLAVQGLWEVKGLFGKGRAARAGYVSAMILAAFLVLLSGRSAGGVIAHYWARPAAFDREALQVEEAVALIPRDAPVYLTNHPARVGPTTGLFAYLLREHPLRGRVASGYSAMSYCLPGEAFPYALLDRDEDPHLLGFSLEDQVWHGGGMALYRRNPEQRSFLDLRQDACPGPDARPVLVHEPLVALQLATSAACREVTVANPLRLYADAEGLHLEEGGSGRSDQFSFLLAWTGLQESEALLRWGSGEEERLTVPAGFSIYRTAAHPVPARLEIAPSGAGSTMVCWAAQVEGEGPTGWTTEPEDVLLATQAQVEGSRLRVRLALSSPGARPLRAVLEVWENVYGAAQHYAWWGPLGLPREGAVTFEMDLASREATTWVGEDRVTTLPAHRGQEAWPAAKDGSYFVALWVYYGGQTVQAIPVAYFDLSGGQVSRLVALPATVVPAWSRSPETLLGASYGESIELAAYERDEGPFDPGDTVHLALAWRPQATVPVNYVVTAQLVGPGRLYGQVDLPAGGEWHPAATWVPGEEVRDDLPVRIDPKAPRGRYRLIVALYDAATMQRLPVRSPTGQELGDALELGEVVVR